MIKKRCKICGKQFVCGRGTGVPENKITCDIWCFKKHRQQYNEERKKEKGRISDAEKTV